MTSPVDALCKEAANLKLEGNDLFKAKKYEAAASKYREAIDKDQCNAVYYTNLCACLNHLKLYKEMHTVATNCIAIQENSVKGHYWLIMSLKKQKKHKEAFVQCELAREQFPDNSDLKLLQAEISMKVKRCAHKNCPVPVANQTDLLKCGACKKIYYCSRDCQKSDWPRHKFICNSGPKQVQCYLCQKMFDYGKQVQCEICKGMCYCSMKCKEEDKERHESKQCRPYFKEMELFDKWFTGSNATSALSELATHAMSKEEFLNQDLEFFIVITLRFCGRYCSFVPIEPPRIVYKSHMNTTEIEDMERQLGFRKSLGPLELGHLLAVRFLHGDLVQDSTIYGQYCLQVTTPKQYQLLSFEEAMTSNFNHVNCEDNPILPPSWKQIHKNYSKHLEKWAEDAQKSGVLVDFVLASYRDQSKVSYRSSKKYTIIIKYEFGERLGEIKQILSHRFQKISGIRNSSLANGIKNLIEKNFASDEKHVEFSLTMVCNNADLANVITVQISMEQMKEKMKSSSDDEEVIEKLWQDLLKLPFPECPPTPEYPDI